MKKLIGIALVSIMAFIIAAIGSKNETTVVVNSINMQQNITSDSDGKTTSETVCMVYTDKGVFEIEQTGLFAHPQLIGTFKPNDNLNIEYFWFDAPILGIYRIITDISYKK